jgi:hypothetical protein
MPASVEQGTIIFREWEGNGGLSESEGTFASLDELFALCLKVDDPKLVDRIILSGHDEHGGPQTVTFTFQSMTRDRG